MIFDMFWVKVWVSFSGVLFIVVSVLCSGNMVGIKCLVSSVCISVFLLLK